MTRIPEPIRGSPNQFGDHAIPKPKKGIPNQNGDCSVTNQNRFGDSSNLGKRALVPKLEWHSIRGHQTNSGIPKLVWAGKLRYCSKSGSPIFGLVILPIRGPTHIFAPPSMRELCVVSVSFTDRITLTYEPSSPFRPHTRGSPTTSATLSMCGHTDNFSSGHVDVVRRGRSNGNLKGDTGEEGQISMPGSMIEPCGMDKFECGQALFKGISYSIRPLRVGTGGV